MQYDSARLTDFSYFGKNNRGRFDRSFFAAVIVLLCVGLISVLSSSYARAFYDPSGLTGGNGYYYFIRQAVFAVLGVICMLAASMIPMRTYRKYSVHFLVLSLILLALVPIIGVKANGAKRWLGVGGLTVQPSELAKLSVALSFSYLICKFKSRMKTARFGLVPFVCILLLISGLLLLEPHFSATVIIIALGGIMMFIGGTSLIWFLLAGGAAAAGFAVLMLFFPYASTRIVTWLDPFSSPSDEGYQIVQSLYSIGSGGIMGLGLGGSRQKFLFLPEEHNDFIFSVFCEETGYIGAVLVLLLFAMLILRGFWIALHCGDRYSFLVCCGITSLLSIQVFLNVAVVTNLIPCTGISLPFFSYGGTALMIQLAEMGIVLSASRDILEIQTE